jgi:putative phosphoesterase
VRLAIVSDIHGNLTALDAVIVDLERREIGWVMHGGDLALAGCQPAEVIDRVRELGWHGVVGNVDDLLWAPEQQVRQRRRAPKLVALLGMLFEQYAPATLELIGPRRLDWLRSLPPEHREGSLVVLHASPGDLWRAPAPDSGDQELVGCYEALDADLVVYGHIHRPYVRRLADFTVANSGSVGSPFDDDPRASYLLIDEDSTEIVRVEYDLEREMALLLGSGYPDAERIAETRRLGRFVPIASRSSNDGGHERNAEESGTSP